MLYRLEWDQTTLLDRWIDFLETKPADEKYQWRWPTGCAVGQFYGGRDWIGLPGFSVLDSIAQGGDDETARTFGKCLARAKQYREWQRLGYLTNAR